MDSGMFYGIQRTVEATLRVKAWFDAMNEIYKRQDLQRSSLKN
jgi:hypothetical protein